MIDISHETLLTFSEACRCLPRRRRGRKASLSTIWRWSRHGLRGIRLEVVRIGGAVFTSREALQRFADRLSVDPARRDGAIDENSRHQASVEAQLRKLGI